MSRYFYNCDVIYNNIYFLTFVFRQELFVNTNNMHLKLGWSRVLHDRLCHKQHFVMTSFQLKAVSTCSS